VVTLFWRRQALEVASSLGPFAQSIPCIYNEGWPWWWNKSKLCGCKMGNASTPTATLPYMKGNVLKDWINGDKGSLSVLLLPFTKISHFDRDNAIYEQISEPSSDCILRRVFQKKKIQVKMSYQKLPSPACSVPLVISLPVVFAFVYL